MGKEDEQKQGCRFQVQGQRGEAEEGWSEGQMMRWTMRGGDGG